MAFRPLDLMNIDAPNCIVEIDGDTPDELASCFLSAEVTVNRTRPTIGRVTLSTTRSDTDGSWNIVDSDFLRPWKTLVIKVILNSEEITLFSGYIIKIEVTFSGTNPQVVVTGQDKTVLMDREHKTRVWGEQDQPVTDGDVVNEIVAEYNLSAETTAGRSHCQLNQDETDIRLLNRLARVNGFELSLTDNSFYFGPPRLSAETQPPILIHMGAETNCSEFNIEDDGYKPDAIQLDVYHDRDYERQTLVPEQTRLGAEPCDEQSIALGSFIWKARLHGVPAESAIAEAQARAEEHAWKIKATGTMNGVTYGGILNPGAPVSVEGIGETHSGTYYVDEVTHQISHRGYNQLFILIRNARGMN